MYVPDKKLRSLILPYRDQIHEMLCAIHPTREFIQIGDTGISLSASFEHARYKSESLSCNYSGGWYFVEEQSEEGHSDSYYSEDLGLDYDSDPEEVIRTLKMVMADIKSNTLGFTS